ncbi:MAG: acetylornithine transaminase [Desulfobacterales bacterium]
MKADVMQTADRFIARTYSRFPLVLEKGRGCVLWDTDGNEYLDFVAGIAVCNLGHAHPAVARAVCEQAEKLVHVSNLYYTEPQTTLAKMLVEKCFADRVFFCNSGAEANEAAIKLARKYFKDKGEPNRYRIIAMKQSFHGRTMATLSATGQEKIRKGFDPVLDGFDFVPFNDISALKEGLREDTCAVLMEPIQGEGGVNCPSPEYMKAVRQLCDDRGVLLMFDEIQTGMGRTGRLFAHEHFGIAPDVMTLAKAMANGLPMGAMLATESVAEAFGPGAHASTFGGTPLVSSAAVAVLEILESDDLTTRSRKTGEYFKGRLEALRKNHSCITDVRGKGLMLGMALDTDGDAVLAACMKKGFLINCIQGKILRFVPPLIITENEIDSLIDCLDAVLPA